MISEPGIRAALLDSMLQEDIATRDRIKARIKAKSLEMLRVRRELDAECEKLRNVERQIISISGALDVHR